MQRLNSADFFDLLSQDIPLLDVRAPIEFSQGAFPMSKNYPLMNDEEREAVGICYKQKGQKEAINLGHQLVNEQLKQQRIASWKAFCEANPKGYLYCFRGGLRSQITQQWLKESGIDYPFVTGGYKALRRFLIETLDNVALMPMTIVGGYTGSGKTILINQLKNGIDLEGAARHRGSSFGGYVTEQRSQISFENSLAVQILKKQRAGIEHFIFEDEGKFIGAVTTPFELHKKMKQSKMVIIEDPFETRLARLLDEYVVKMQQEFVAIKGEEQGWLGFSEYLAQAMFKIQRRLGLERYQSLLDIQKKAIIAMQNSGSAIGHEAWLAPLLKQYYDPMYEYQLSQNSDRVVFKGDYQQVNDWLVN